MEEGNETEEKRCLRVKLVCLVLVVGLDIVAGFVGLQAEAAEHDVKYDRVWLLEYKAPSKTAFVLGIIAVSCLAAAHIIVNVIGCSISNLFQALGAVPNITTYVNTACLYLNWIVGIVGGAFLAVGIWSNRESRTECVFTNKHVLSFGAKVCFLHAIFSVVYFVSSILAKKS